MSHVSVSDLYHVGDTWMHRLHPLTKLAAAVPLTVAGFVGQGPTTPLILVAALAGILAASRLVSVMTTSLRLLAPIMVALFVIHVLLRPYDSPPIAEWGALRLSREGLVFAVTTSARLGVFVLAVTAAMSTVHPKAFATALIQRRVSHKLAYAYLAGAELLPDMKRRARQILDAQQSRGFDVRGTPWRRLRTLFALLKPLLLGALIGVETRTLALESRGFSRPGPRTSTAAVADPPAERIVQRALLLAGLALIFVAFAW